MIRRRERSKLLVVICSNLAFQKKVNNNCKNTKFLTFYSSKESYDFFKLTRETHFCPSHVCFY
jgi:hypothetical protein